ncbi:MAG: hypothetical protein ABFS45_17005 [Pseudomonadota bacterium]
MFSDLQRYTPCNNTITSFLSALALEDVLKEAARQFRGDGDQLDDITLVELTC